MHFGSASELGGFSAFVGKERFSLSFFFYPSAFIITRGHFNDRLLALAAPSRPLSDTRSGEDG